jgi:hypothetical protein
MLLSEIPFSIGTGPSSQSVIESVKKNPTGDTTTTTATTTTTTAITTTTTTTTTTTNNNNYYNYYYYYYYYHHHSGWGGLYTDLVLDIKPLPPKTAVKRQQSEL